MNEFYAARIYRVVASLSHRVTTEDVADAIVDEVRTALGASAATVLLFDDASATIRVVRARGYPAAVLDLWQGRPIRLYAVTALAHDGVPAFTRSRLEDARFDARLKEHFGDGAAFVVPMQSSGSVVGCLGASFDHVRDFADEERGFILALANQCAQSIERARLFEAEQRARQAADAARRELEAVLQQLPVAVVIVDANGHTVVNDQVNAIYGASMRTLDRRNYSASVTKHPDGTPYREADLPIVRALAGETVVKEEVLVRRSDGELRRVRVNARPVLGEDGRVDKAVAVFSDVTEEHRAAAELQAHDRRYRALLRATNDVIWELDPMTRRLEWNGELERQFGWKPGDPERHPGGGFSWWMEQIHPDDRAAVVATYEEAAAAGHETWTSEYRFRRADGTWVLTLDRCVFERDESGRLLRVIGAISDVSEPQRLLQELRSAVAVRDDFLSIAGHELRTPMAALSAHLFGLARLPLDEAGRARKLDAAERQVRRLTSLVDELLNVSRIVHGTLHLEREAVDLASLAAGAATRLADDFQRAGTALHVAAAAPVVGQWDPLRIDLVVTNLLTNALRYGQKKPVSMTVEGDSERARVIVEDHGIGIDAADQQRIFERFVRVAPSRQFGGLGVGLWLSQQIAATHGGHLSVESALGQGARFVLELPRAVAP